jgi:hypothetical protein
MGRLGGGSWPQGLALQLRSDAAGGAGRVATTASSPRHLGSPPAEIFVLLLGSEKLRLLVFHFAGSDFLADAKYFLWNFRI